MRRCLDLLHGGFQVFGVYVVDAPALRQALEQLTGFNHDQRQPRDLSRFNGPVGFEASVSVFVRDVDDSRDLEPQLAVTGDDLIKRALTHLGDGDKAR